jgi:hypothetical protein
LAPIAEALVPNKQPLIPGEFAKAICNGILHSMMTDYAARVPQELSYRALGESGDDMEVQEVEEVLDEAAQDECQSFPDRIVRHHLFPRKALFSPMSVEELPCHFSRLLPPRHFHDPFRWSSTAA